MFRTIIILFILSVLTGCAASQASEPVVLESKTVITCSCRSDRYNCADFKTRRKAREKYECCMRKVGYDVHNLDRDSDGIACEW
ncbi:excalibur calcium-binding domain-containing protein [Candidatus Parcubacteria bacterium]|nr:excalibur calcium-binding domain-containing protein [Candidatus Parcubacteria bacterium]